jgi:hypothetical protein
MDKDTRVQALKDALVGKTIERIDTDSINVLFLYFTDGTSIALEPENILMGIFGVVAYPIKNYGR